ncbi:hypothetical protein VT50_0216630 [Streptomyces antioxidans]|uniref:HNH endonuclease n=1 Tax=Streptomyces antioxidans TaxID=1507734 RepID=A0A1V4D4S1_9ACTN|nr:hypothetical protein VT50_0216630 [Streptomyces antioxidans]
MARCKNAARAIGQNDTRNLYADAAGRCQNPSCLNPVLVRAENSVRVNVGELAHIIAASPKGPRGDSVIDPSALALEQNLILLCLVCHKIVDSEESAYPVELLQTWKSSHEARISSAFGARAFDRCEEARYTLESYLRSNRSTFDAFGPNSESSWNPLSDAVDIWRVRVREVIIPNNRMILRLLDFNTHLLSSAELTVLEKFRVHVEEFERKHVFGAMSSSVPRFPEEMNEMLCREGV